MMSRFGILLRAAGCVALTATGAPAFAQYSAAVVDPSADVVDAGHFRRAAPQGYYHPGSYPQNCPPATAPGMAIPGMTMPPAPTPAPAVQAPTVPDLYAGADAGPTAGLGGYIDNALPMTQFRLRFDGNYGNNRPDRANFFYAKCGCFPAPNAVGPPLPETSVDSQTLYSYVEYAITPRASVFGNIPVRFINPEQNRNAAGISDLQFGGKYALVYNADRVLSIQMQVIVPTGDTRQGLGTGSTWLEPGLLYQEQLSRRWQVFGQLKDQIPLTRVSDFAGNVLTYGVGTSYTVMEGSWGYVAPVAEVVGWTVLSGRELNPDAGVDVSAEGATIVNAKFGVRIGLGRSECDGPNATRSDLYLGYGRALTGEVWYKNMFRVEYRWMY